MIMNDDDHGSQEDDREHDDDDDDDDVVDVRSDSHGSRQLQSSRIDSHNQNGSHSRYIAR